MENWNFDTKYKPKAIIEKLRKEFNPTREFLFEEMNYNNEISFKVRKRIMYGWYMAFHNWTIANGTISQDESSAKTNVSIVFKQHFFIWLIVATHSFLGIALLVAVFSSAINEISTYLIGSVIICLGIVLWIVVHKKFKKDVGTYKGLINSILKA